MLTRGLKPALYDCSLTRGLKPALYDYQLTRGLKPALYEWRMRGYSPRATSVRSRSTQRLE